MFFVGGCRVGWVWFWAVVLDGVFVVCVFDSIRVFVLLEWLSFLFGV